MSRIRTAMLCRPAPLCRRDDDGELRTYSDVVDTYIRDHRDDTNDLLQFFAQRPTLASAIGEAARCRLPSGNRHPHQYRIPRRVLAQAERCLQASAARLSACQTFADLHELVQNRIGGLRGIGALTVYDVANHLGAYLGLEPELVYLHAGTAGGARALGLDHRAEALDPAELPAEFRWLRPSEVEDCLCMYQDELEAIRRRTRRCT